MGIWYSCFCHLYNLGIVIRDTIRLDLQLIQVEVDCFTSSNSPSLNFDWNLDTSSLAGDVTFIEHGFGVGIYVYVDLCRSAHPFLSTSTTRPRMGAQVSTAKSFSKQKFLTEIVQQCGTSSCQNKIGTLKIEAKGDASIDDARITQQCRVDSTCVFSAVAKAVADSEADAAAKAKAGLGAAVANTNARTEQEVLNEQYQTCGVKDVSNTVKELEVSAADTAGIKNFSFDQIGDVKSECIFNGLVDQVVKNSASADSTAEGASLLDLLGPGGFLLLLAAGGMFGLVFMAKSGVLGLFSIYAFRMLVWLGVGIGLLSVFGWCWGDCPGAEGGGGDQGRIQEYVQSWVDSEIAPTVRWIGWALLGVAVLDTMLTVMVAVYAGRRSSSPESVIPLAPAAVASSTVAPVSKAKPIVRHRHRHARVKLDFQKGLLSPSGNPILTTLHLKRYGIDGGGAAAAAPTSRKQRAVVMSHHRRRTP